MQPGSNSSSLTPNFLAQLSEVERRGRFRGNDQYDLCNFLEAFRRRERLSAVSLSDADGFVVAGAGSFAQCEELGAQAARTSAAAEISSGAASLRLSLSKQNAEPLDPTDALRAEVGQACRRILGSSRRKLPSGLLG